MKYKIKMERNKKYTQETTRNNQPSHHGTPQAREEEVGHETPGIKTRKKETKEMGYTRREMERMVTDRKRWRSLVCGLCYGYAPSERKGISN